MNDRQMGRRFMEDASPAWMKQPHCRWCDHLVIRGLPCVCDRAQEEARRVRAGP